MMLDIDHFKRVNDSYGHQTGDEALQVVTKTIKEATSKTDFIGRYGGEEILVVTPETNLNNSKALAQRILEAVRNTPIPLKDGKTFNVTVSIGVASFFNGTKWHSDLNKEC